MSDRLERLRADDKELLGVQLVLRGLCPGCR